MGNSIITKPIVGYEGKYEVDSEGVIWSLNYKRLGFRKPLVPVPNGHDYLQVGLSSGGSVKRFMVHRLVADAFLENHDNKAEVNHKNGIKSDNRLSNLEWSTSKENKEHARTVLGIIPHGGGVPPVCSGESNGMSKMKEPQVRCIKALAGPVNISALAREYGVSRKTIQNIRSGKMWIGVS